MLAKAMSRFYKLLVRSPEANTAYTAIIEHRYGQGFTSFPSSSTSAEYYGVLYSAGSAPLTPVLSVCICLVILAPVCSPAHYLLQ